MSTDISSQFRRENRGQAYTVEAIIAALLVVTIVIFVAPSFATPATHAELDQLREEAEVEDEVGELLKTQASNGELKSAILNYNQEDEAWRDGFTNPEEGHYIDPPNTDFGESIEDIENRHNVSINIFLIPESTESQGENPDRVTFLNQGEPGTNFVTESKTLVFYDRDRLQSDAEVHTRDGTATPQFEGTGDRLEDADDFPIEQAERDTESVYNVVTVKVIVNEAD